MKIIRKYLGFIAGFLTCLLAVQTAHAASEYLCMVVEYPVYIDGVEYSNETLPLLNYEGNTYAPMKSILEAAGLEVVWDDATSSVIVKTAGLLSGAVAEPDNITTESEKTPDGIRIRENSEGKYVLASEFIAKYKDSGISFGASTRIQTGISSSIITSIEILKNGEVILTATELNSTVGYGAAFDYDYYINTILPTVEASLAG
jgi:hypothetical protein